MSGFTKKSIDKYIRNNIMFWIYDLGHNAPKFLKEELKLSGKEELTDEDKDAILTFQQMVRDNTIVTGGCFTSMLQGEQPNDLDIYLKDKKVGTLIAQFYINKMIDVGSLLKTDHVHQIRVDETEDGLHILIRSQGVAGEEINTDDYRYFEAFPEAATDDFFAQYKKSMGKKINDLPKYGVQFLTSNAITLSGGIQIITRFTGTPEEIHSNFDYIHATNYWTWDEGVVYNMEALRATSEKRLYYFGSKFPVASIFRLKKFIERGWRISAGEIVKILYDVSKLDLDDVSVLREQSMGCDSAYFSEVIQLLQKEGKQDNLDRKYLFQCIEIAFNMSDPMDNFLETQSQEDQDKNLSSGEFDLDLSNEISGESPELTSNPDYEMKWDNGNLIYIKKGVIT